MQYGATKAQWEHFAHTLGLVADLLPVVSNPNAVVSSTSKMKTVGKVPSVYTRERQVVGLAGWTDRRTLTGDVAKWMAEPDYGICLQTREVRALDIDIDDADAAREVSQAVELFLTPLLLPCRSRAGSGKVLYAFRLPGAYSKRILRTAHGIIEFLATGQQFIAAGTHTSGTPYVWDNGGFPPEIPEMDAEEFEALWAMLEKTFAIAPSTTAGVRRRGESLGLQDDTIDLLEEKGLVLGYGREGQAFITCPWKHEHSMDSGETETAYFPRGTGGYEQGHFKCLHASHAGKTDADFEAALGLVEHHFEVLPPEVNAKGKVVVQMSPVRRDKLGRIEGLLSNVRAALAHENFNLGWDIRFDNFLCDVVIDKGDGFLPVMDDDYTSLSVNFERRGFKNCSVEHMRRAVMNHAFDNRFDSMTNWLSGLRWDGVPRVSTFMPVYMSTEDTDYARAVGEYWWTAMAGRVLVPGIKADMMPILVSEQGMMKSSTFAAMVPDANQFVTLSFAQIGEDNMRRLMKGKILGEFPELKGLDSRDLESIKAFITEEKDEWIEKYQVARTTYLRRMVFVGSTNLHDILADPTGNRRFLPIVVGAKINQKEMVRDKLQLWAEAAHMFRSAGVHWQRAEFLAKAEHAKFRKVSILEETVHDFLFGADSDAELCWLEKNDNIVSVREIVEQCLYGDTNRGRTNTEKNIRDALIALGGRSTQRRRAKKRVTIRGFEFDPEHVKNCKFVVDDIT